MNINCWILITLYVYLWTISETIAQTAICDYKYGYFWANGFKTTSASYYKCEFSAWQENYSERIARIDGQHLSGHSDADVKYIANYEGSKVKKLSSIFCQKFPKLELIQIINAELESIDEDSLGNCPNLNHLLLNGNKIQEIPENFLFQNTKLSLFWIYHNQLTALPENLFLTQNELKELDASDNKINFLPSNIFEPLIMLEELYLSGNKLQSISPEWFATLQNLKRLLMGGNQVLDIPSNCFASLRNLEKLSLYENKIKTLNADNFDGLQNLELLSLSNNGISDLPFATFSPLTNLKELSLNNNKLTALYSDSFGSHDQLAKIWLENNKINAIDPKIIDNTAVSILNMENNVCSQLLITSKKEIKPNLKKCFDNFQPRPQPQPQPPTFRPTIPTRQTTKQINICGKSKIGRSNIIGGIQINSGDYPWIAALMRQAREFFCGGTLVSSRKIVTAAHCIKDKHSSDQFLAGDIIVLLGVHDLDNSFEIGRTSNAVYSINVNPEWNIKTSAYDADIAVLVLEKEVTFNENIQPICLPVQNTNLDKIVSGSVVGYGKSEDETKEHENIPKILETPIHINDDCFKANEDLISLSSGRTFCGGSGKGVGVCKGDSGSGLIVSDGSAFYLRGVVSASLLNGHHECDVDTYAIFTDVLKFVDWINGIPTDRFA